MCAEPTSPTRFSSSLLADRLVDVVNEGRGERWSLGVPEFISRIFKGHDADVIRRHHLHASDSYRRIFGPEDPLIERVDSVLTSIGFAERPLGQRNKGLLKAGEVTADELRKLVVGDIGGVLIPRPGLKAGDRQTVDQLNAMWTGMTLDHIRRIARDAASSSHRPGIIVVSIGRQKAEILAEIIRSGLVNELIIDEDLAGALDLRSQASTPSAAGVPHVVGQV